ncbi:MAG TPA: right-handed parallel beta-helix repeat-containing protein [Actinomycetota bacterium]|nr:right-handed parallel beta-helix repeat-containing protein [Actinomycetota bacterium]
MRAAIRILLPLALAGSAAMLPTTSAAAGQIRVPQDQQDLQAAIEAARPGDVILLDRGTYTGDVVVPEEIHDITIRGVDRNAVVFDGGDVRENAIYIEGDGVTLENMTAHNFQGNGFYWEGVERFTGRYLTVYNVGFYGIYAIQSRGGLFEHSLVSGAADAAFYVGECSPCDTMLTDLTARLSAVGYSGTNTSGNVIVQNSRWELNGVGILPNSYDVGIAPPPQRGSRFTGNVVLGSGTVDVPLNTPLRGFRGIGIGIAGGSDNVVENNIVENSARYGIAVFSSVDAENTWMPEGNRVTSNHVRGSGTADLAFAAGSGASNCFEKNRHESTVPADLDGPCDSALVGSQDVADELVLPPPELAELDPSLELAPSYTEIEPPGPHRTSPTGGEESSAAMPLGVIAVVAGALLLAVQLSGRRSMMLLLAGVVLVGWGSVFLFLSARDPDVSVTAPGLGGTPSLSPSGPSPDGESPSSAKGQLTVVEVSTLDRLPGTQGETHKAKKGTGFFVVEARLQSTQGPAELSSEQARIVAADGEALPAIGAGETEFCVDCAFGVSSDGEAVLSFVFVIPVERMDETFSFHYEGFPEISVSTSGDIGSSVVASGPGQPTAAYP